MRTIYALLVGIDHYPIKEHRLSGCLNDVANITQFLESHCLVNDLHCQIKELTNRAATRQNILDGIQHFNNAKEGDVCIFYFSGQGGQVQTDVASIGKLGSIVGYDSRLKKGRDILHKEITYLLEKQVGINHKIHCVQILDCGQGGRVTSNESRTNRLLPRHPTIHQLTELEGGTKKLKPSNMIQLMAAKSYQAASEMSIDGQQQGLFTWALLRALEVGNLGILSYNNLLAEMVTTMRYKAEDQQPIVVTSKQNLKNTSFLNGLFKYHQKAILEWGDQQGWLINKGKLDRVQSKAPLQIKDGATIHIANIRTVKSTVSLLQNLDWADKTMTYPVISMSLVPNKLKVAFKNRVKHPALKALKKGLKVKQDLLELVYKKELADYWILQQDNQIALCRPGEERPVFKRVPITDDQQDGFFNSAILFQQQLAQVAHYEHISKMGNPNSEIDLNKVLNIQLTEIQNDQLISRNPNEPLFLDYAAHEGKLVKPAIQLTVQNKAPQSLWVTALFMAEDYSIRDIFMPVKELIPNSAAYEFAIPAGDASSISTIKLGIGDDLLSWGIHDICNQIKIITSTIPFTVDKLVQAGLVQEVNDTRGGTATMEHQVFGETFSTAEDNWAVQNIALHIHRPQNGLPFTGKTALALTGMQLAPHSDFSAKVVRLSSSEQATRSDLVTDKSPSHVFSSEFLQPFQPTGTRASQQTLDILELHDVSNVDSVTPENPLKVALDVPLEKGKVVIPFGYDKATDLFIPMGFVDKDGKTVFIEALPDETAASTRGFFKSIKIFLVETVRKITGKKPKYPILAIADVDDDENLTYIDQKAAIKEAVKNAKRILIMVHGLIGDTSDKAKIMKRIKQEHNGKIRTISDEYDVLLTFDYESMHRHIQKTGKDLKKKLEAVGIKKGHGKEVHIIAHSMGGLVSRWYLEQEKGLEVINHFIQVGSPNLGSPVANKAMLATSAIGAILNFIPKPPLVAGMIRFIGFIWNRATVSTRQLKPNSKFYKELNGRGRVPKITIPYTILPGDITLNSSNPKEQKFFKRMMNRYRQKMFQEGNDGVVAVSSIKGVPVPSGRMVERLPSIPCNHFSYFNTPHGEAELARVLFELADG